MALSKFEKFCQQKYDLTTDQMIVKLQTFDENRLYLFLDNFVAFLDENLHPKTIRTYFGFVRKYLRLQGVKTYLDDIKVLIQFPTIPVEERRPITRETIKKLLDNSKEKRRALYLTLISSGMRIGETTALRKRDFDFEKNPVQINIPSGITKKKYGRPTWISREAEVLVRKIVGRKKPDDLVFADNGDPIQALHNEEVDFSNLRKRCGLTERYPNSDRFLVNIHCFRAYCETKASHVHGEEFAHVLIGHTNYLKYYRKTIDERAELYKELESELLIYDESQKNAQIEKLQKEKSENTLLEQRISDLEKKNEKQHEFVEMLLDVPPKNMKYISLE